MAPVLVVLDAVLIVFVQIPVQNSWWKDTEVLGVLMLSLFCLYRFLSRTESMKGCSDPWWLSCCSNFICTDSCPEQSWWKDAVILDDLHAALLLFVQIPVQNRVDERTQWSLMTFMLPYFCLHRFLSRTELMKGCSDPWWPSCCPTFVSTDSCPEQSEDTTVFGIIYAVLILFVQILVQNGVGGTTQRSLMSFMPVPLQRQIGVRPVINECPCCPNFVCPEACPGRNHWKGAVGVPPHGASPVLLLNPASWHLQHR